MLDTHCHLTFPEFAASLDQTLDDAMAMGVTGAITISTDTQDAEASVRVAESHPRIWASVGVHPLYADREPHDWDRLRELARHPKVVAWGELGLDNHYDHPPRDLQHRVLADELACIESAATDGVNLPIVIHCREAFDDLLPILRSTHLPADRFVFHCFTAGPDEARQVLDFGAWISFTGVATYRNAREVAEAATLVPDDRVMVETDAPFLSPDPKRGVRPCVPAYARYTAEFLAEIRGTPWPEFHALLDANTERFFGIKVPTADPEVIATCVR